MEPAAPRSEMIAERTKAPAKVPVESLIHPATAGPRDWPMPKMRVMNPRAAGSAEDVKMPRAAARGASLAKLQDLLRVPFHSLLWSQKLKIPIAYHWALMKPAMVSNRSS
jgi:hypothetical protein